ICTELLYQPLTLLDCLHTFCGSCLKEWFTAQASRRRPRSRSSVQCTCPSCRAVVRETRPNATVTTLLDMVLAANPERERPEEEKEEIAQRYKPGDSVFPAVASPEDSPSRPDDEDERLLEEVRELSLRDSRARSREPRSAHPSRTRRGGSHDGHGRREGTRSRQQREEERSARRQGQRTTRADVSEHTRRIEHQSSLRSLLSLSDAETMQEEILRQIFEEGLLDDIDLDNLGPSQEEELSERIADAYRRRHRLRSRSQQRQDAPEAVGSSNRPRARSQSTQRTQAPASGSRESSAHPPVSRPYLLEPLVQRPGASSHQRRLSDQGKGANERELRRQRPSRQSIDSPMFLPSTVRSPRNASFSLRNLAAEVNSSSRPEARSRPSSSRSNAPHSPASYLEPSISCDRCGRPNIQYELHKKCQQCKDDWPGFGASAKADIDRIRASSDGLATSLQDSQHVLLSMKYNRPSDAVRRSARDDRDVTNENPSRRLQTGLFCDLCQSHADGCFWKCNQCVNEGKCCTHALLPICPNPPSSSDVPNGLSTSTANETLKVLSFSTNCDICATPIPASTLRFHCLQCNHGDYDICANCYLKLVATAKIRKDNGHNGWRRCLKGHRMVVKRVIVRDLVGGRALKDEHLQGPSTPLTPSFSRSFATSTGATPSPEVGTGDWSWKEGTERRKKASRVRAPWSGASTERANNYSEPSTPTTPSRNTPSPRRFPPDGGVDGVKDELMFPRGAEITEAENINDDWYWGCYAGSTGLFPGTHVFVAGEVV
ncbi:hypothetical protein BDV25DRAFT_148711, partial [Aspergillus avenaceus]